MCHESSENSSNANPRGRELLRSPADPMLLSVVVPARNEAGSIAETLAGLIEALDAGAIPFEIVVVDDGSGDGTAGAAAECSGRARVQVIRNHRPSGFGYAVRTGLAKCSGGAVAVVMADGSDSPADLVRYYDKLQEGYECVFGSRFINGGRVIDYPPHKLLINRMANWFIRILFRIRYNDITNAFKCYRREAIEGMQPLISPHFNLTVEMPLKAIIRGYSYAVIPVSWTNRKTGISKLKIKEMGSRYLFIVLYLWLERFLSRGDYRRQHEKASAATATSRHA